MPIRPLHPPLRVLSGFLLATPPLAAGMLVTVDRAWLQPGGEAFLTARWSGAGTAPPGTWSLEDPGDGQLEPDARGGCRFRARHYLPRTRMVRVRLAWTDPGSGAPAQQDTVLQVRPGWSGRTPKVYAGDLPGTILDKAWLALDREGGRILLVDAEGRARPWVGGPRPEDPDAPPVFQDPTALAVRPLATPDVNAWELVVVDRGAHVLRRVDALGHVQTLAGGFREPGAPQDGALREARFHHPTGAAFDGDDLYVTDAGNHCIRRITGDRIETVAGSPDRAAWADGKGAAAGLPGPGALALAPRSIPLGRLLFLDQNRLRLLMSNRAVLTLAGSGQPGFEAKAPEGAKLARLAGIACLDRPSELTVDGDRALVRDQDGRALVALEMGKGPSQGLLTTLEPPARPQEAKSTAAAPLENKSHAAKPRNGLADGKSAPAEARPAALDLRPEREVLVAGGGTVEDTRKDDSRLARTLWMDGGRVVPLADGSLVLFRWQRAKMGLEGAKATLKHIRYERADQFLHLFADPDGTWRYRVIPWEKTRRPDRIVDLWPGPEGSLYVSDDQFHRLRLEGEGNAWEIAGIERLVDMSAEKRLGAQSMFSWCGPDGSRVHASPDQLVWEPPGALDSKSAVWLAGKPSEAVRRQSGRDIRYFKSLEDHTHKAYLSGYQAHAADGTLYVANYHQQRAFAFDPKTRKKTELATPATWPWDESCQHGAIAAFGGVLAMSGRRQPGQESDSVCLLKPAEKRGGLHEVEFLDLDFPKGRGVDQLRFTPKGDLLVVEMDRIRLVPNVCQPAFTGVEAAPEPEAAPPGPAGPSAEDADRAMEQLLREIAEEERREAHRQRQRAGKEEGKAEAKSDATATDLEPDDGEGSDSEAHDPEPDELPLLTPHRNPAPARAPARRAPILRAPARELRYLPVLGPRNRLDLVNGMERFLATRFNEAFKAMWERHQDREAFNDHSYKGVNSHRDRLARMLQRRGLAPDGDLSRLDGEFFLSDKTVLAIARWMLRHAGEAGRPEDLARWEQAGRPPRPEFPFGLYIQDGQAERDNRIVLDLRDVRLARNLPPRARDELKAAGYATGFRAREGQELRFTQGIRLVLFPGCAGVATCHPVALHPERLERSGPSSTPSTPPPAQLKDWLPPSAAPVRSAWSAGRPDLDTGAGILPPNAEGMAYTNLAVPATSQAQATGSE